MAFNGEVKPGQFFEVSVPKYGEAPISVSGIGPGFVDLTIRKVGRVTNEVFETYAGQNLLLRGPYGNGFDVGLYREGETVVVAGGTGVSPVRGVISALAQMDNAKDKYAITGFRSPSDMLFRDDLEAWEKRLNLILTVDGAPEGYEGNVGLVTKYIADLPLRIRLRQRRSWSDRANDEVYDHRAEEEGVCGREHHGILRAQDVLRAWKVRALPGQ